MARGRPSSWELYVEPAIGILALAVTFATCAAIARISEAAPNDFTVFLESARWLRQGADVYQRPLQPGPGYNLNPPPVVLLFVPLSFLPDWLALFLWTALAAAAYVLAAYWIARTAAPGRMVSIAGAIFLSQPGIMSMLLGQTGALLMLLVTAAWAADREERPGLAGVLLGIAIAAKPFLAWCAAYALWRRSRALAAGLAAGVAGMVSLGLLSSGVEGFRSWLNAIRQISWTAHVANASLLGLLTRTMSVTPEVLHATPVVDRPQLVQPLWWAAVALVGIVTVVMLVRTRNRDRAWAILLIAPARLAARMGVLRDDRDWTPARRRANDVAAGAGHDCRRMRLRKHSAIDHDVAGRARHPRARIDLRVGIPSAVRRRRHRKREPHPAAADRVGLECRV